MSQICLSLGPKSFFSVFPAGKDSSEDYARVRASPQGCSFLLFKSLIISLPPSVATCLTLKVNNQDEECEGHLISDISRPCQLAKRPLCDLDKRTDRETDF